MRKLSAFIAAALFCAAAWHSHAKPLTAAPRKVTWKKTVVEAKYRSEGVAAGDVNKDGKTDILVGDLWYQAPGWEPRAIRPLKDFGDGANGYSDAFACFTDDFNRDGWVDLLVIGMPGTPCHWYENPQNKPGHWKQHVVWKSACNETPLYEDLLGDGQRRLIMASQPEGQMFWFSVPADPTALWEAHPISKASTPEEKVPGTERFSHGLGAGDVNGDGRRDVLVRQGWWEQPAEAVKRAEPWTFHAANLGEDCADMHVVDVDQDGLNDVLSSAAHHQGIWWHRQTSDGKGKTEWTRHTILNEFSQTHSLNFVDMNGDGRKDLITGKRWWAHGPGGDVDPNKAAVLYWIEIGKARTTTQQAADRNTTTVTAEIVAHQIDDNSGVGTQFTVLDMNDDKLPDVVVSNKKGVHVLHQGQ